MNKSKEIGGPFFKIAKGVIEDPTTYVSDEDSMMVSQLMVQLSDDERIKLYNICDFMQEGIEHHFQYLVDSGYLIKKFEADQMFIFKSYFELVCLHWVIITNILNKQNVRKEIPHALYWTIKYSFSGHEGIFRQSPYLQFDTAFQTKLPFYIESMNNYFAPDQITAYYDIFDSMIENPLSAVADEVARIMTLNMMDTPRTSNVVAFKKALSRDIISLHKQIATIKFGHSK